MIRVIFTSIAVITLVLVLGFAFMAKRPDLAQYDHLTAPRISTLDSTQVMTVTIEGDPNTVGRMAFGKLFGAFYKLRRTVKDIPLVAPRARWVANAHTPRELWRGIYAIPVPNTITPSTLVDVQADSSIKIDIWKYGEVAEILHKGPYSTELPTIQKLRDFIDSNGYTIAGDHEEEYLKGPGLFGKGDPSKYYTIIRYLVSKVEAKADSGVTSEIQ